MCRERLQNDAISVVKYAGAVGDKSNKALAGSWRRN